MQLKKLRLATKDRPGLRTDGADCHGNNQALRNWVVAASG